MTASIIVGIAGGRGELGIPARRRVESHYGLDNLQAAVLGVTCAETGGERIVSWVGLTVNAHSAFHAYKSQCGNPREPSSSGLTAVSPSS
jgi:hypothetical protein